MRMRPASVSIHRSRVHRLMMRMVVSTVVPAMSARFWRVKVRRRRISPSRSSPNFSAIRKRTAASRASALAVASRSREVPDSRRRLIITSRVRMARWGWRLVTSRNHVPSIRRQTEGSSALAEAGIGIPCRTATAATSSPGPKTSRTKSLPSRDCLETCRRPLTRP